MIALRPFFAICLAVSLVLTSGAMAVARGQTQDSVGNIILCTGHGVVWVAIDSNGDPVGPIHICPDCALQAFDVPAFASLELGAHRPDQIHHAEAKASIGARSVFGTNLARAPPV